MVEPEIRKIVTIVEEIYGDGTRNLARPQRLAAAVAVIKNPYAGRYEEDLGELGGVMSKSLGPRLTALAEDALGTPARVFGKATLVGEAGEVQHGSAIIHTKDFGDELRRAAGGHAVVPAAEKRAGTGATLDVSLRNAQDNGDLAGTSVPDLYSWEIRVSDAPRADEMLIVAALGDGGRPNSRTGEAR